MPEEIDVQAFQGFRKIPRLSRECICTEKIDGTNACIYIAADSQPFTLKSGRVVPFLVGCRTRWIYPEADNHGFATWAFGHAEELLKLGPGRHFGEWWGSGINRGYGKVKGEKVFSLFNTEKWNAETVPACCSVVPVLYTGMFTTDAVEACVDLLRHDGSVAAPGFLKPEGVVVYHIQGNLYFKKTLEGDEYWKTRDEEPAEPKRRAPKNLESLGQMPHPQVSF